MERELDLIVRARSEYGTHYFRRYFGVSFREIAAKVGMSEQALSNVLQGKRKLREHKAERLLDVVRAMGLPDRIASFKETDDQRGSRLAWRSMKNKLDNPGLSS